MSVRGLNHAVLFVSDVTRSVHFYTTVLGFEKLPMDFPGAAFLRGANSANDHDLGLFQHPLRAAGTDRWGCITWPGRSRHSRTWLPPATG